MSSSSRDIARELRRAVEVQGEKELKRKGREFANEVADDVRSFAPEDSGEFRDSIVVRNRYRKGSMPAWRITSTDPKASVIEFGSDDRPQGGSSPEFAPFAKAALKHGASGGDDE